MRSRLIARARHALLIAALVAATVPPVTGQTPIKLDRNKYTPAQDVQIGQEAAAEVRRELPLLDDDRVSAWVERVGRDLVRAIPQQFSNREFRYTFEVVNQAEINAFALPGGPMFLHRGMIEAAKTQGETAGVMAHEISHVALRHGTAQATKGQRFQIGAVAGQVLGAIVGGAAGSVIAQTSSFGLGAYFLKFGREYERQADLLGAQIMARAGYDPRHMAEMFRTIEAKSGGSGGPEWLSSHPSPGNRYEAIMREAGMLRIEGRMPSDEEFTAIHARLRGLPPAFTAEQIARAKASGRRLPTGGGRAEPTTSRGGVDPPSSRYQQLRVGDFMRLQVPANWRQVSDRGSVTFAPDGAFYRGRGGQDGFTHGFQVGVVSGEAHSHQEGTDELLESLQRANPRLSRQGGGYIRERIGGRTALSTTLRNVSEATGGAEAVGLSTLLLRDGSLLYFISVAPQDELATYDATFQRMKQSIEIDDRRLRD
ncbi:MAG: M48 family metallopeptidase [Acidobacteriota bacterium]